jgi:hypothetical protein
MIVLQAAGFVLLYVGAEAGMYYYIATVFRT